MGFFDNLKNYRSKAEDLLIFQSNDEIELVKRCFLCNSQDVFASHEAHAICKPCYRVAMLKHGIGVQAHGD